MNNPNSGSKRLRLFVVGLCLLAAFAAALFVRRSEHRTSTPATTATQPAKSPEEILALIPKTPGDSAADQAIAKARARVAAKPTVALDWATLGDCLMQKARDITDETLYDPAELAYLEAFRIDPRNVGAMAGMAWVKGDRHLFDESIEWANKAIGVDPGNAAAYGILGDAALQLGDYDQAFAHYQKMMDLRPDISSYSRGAYLLWVTGKKQNAINLMGKAIRAGGPYAENTAWCRSRLALMLFNDGAYLPAEQTLAPSLEAVPRNMHVLLVAGKIRAALQDYAGAKEFYQRAQDVAPNLEALIALGDIATMQGAKSEADAYYQKAEELHAAHVARQGHDHMQMALFYADHDRNLVEALRMAEQRKLTRNVFEADTLAWVYFKNGQLEKAQEAIGRALSQKTPDPSIQYHAGMIAAKAGNRPVAQKYLETALSWSPSFSLLGAPRALETMRDLGNHPVAANGATPAAKE